MSRSGVKNRRELEALPDPDVTVDEAVMLELEAAQLRELVEQLPRD